MRSAAEDRLADAVQDESEVAGGLGGERRVLGDLAGGVGEVHHPRRRRALATAEDAVAQPEVQRGPGDDDEVRAAEGGAPGLGDEQRVATGMAVKRTRLTEAFRLRDFKNRYGEDTVLMFAVKDGHLTVLSEDSKLPQHGVSVIALVRDLAPEQKGQRKAEKKAQKKGPGRGNGRPAGEPEPAGGRPARQGSGIP